MKCGRVFIELTPSDTTDYRGRMDKVYRWRFAFDERPPTFYRSRRMAVMSFDATASFPNALADTSDAHVPNEPLSPVQIATIGNSATTISHRYVVPDESDEFLLHRVSDGNKEALSILFRRHQRAVLNVAWRILRDSSEAEDLRQEVFLYLFEKAKLFDPDKGSAASWIIQIAYHRAIDRRRYLDFRQQYDVQQLDEQRQPASGGPPLIDEVAAKALLNQLRNQLSTEQHETLELHFLEGYSFREIAGKTGQTFGNVRNHYYRALERLRSSVFPQERRRSEKIGRQ
jgi:RNA polymerase sigma-70 factor (ECF subfamily)